MKNLLRIFILLSFFSLVSLTADAQTTINRSETVRKASEAMARGDVAGAMAILDKAIEKKKDLFEAYRMRATIRPLRGDLDGAISDLSAAIEIQPDGADLYEQRARFRMFRRDLTGALKDYDQAIARGVKSEKVYTGRGDIKRDNGDYESAVADYQTAVGINPNYVQAYSGWSFTLERRGDIDGAILRLEEFLNRFERERNGKLPSVKLDGSGVSGTLIKREGANADGSQMIMQGQGSFRTAGGTAEELQKEAETFEQNLNISGAYGNLGKLYEKKEIFDKALLNYGKAISIKSGDGYLLASRGKLRLKMNDVKGAIADLSAAADSRFNAPDRNADKGILLILQGKDYEAQIEFNKYLQMFPNAKDFLNKRIEDARQKRQQQ